ncbi:hypothetical protein K7I13_01425 [Brucepastera parasyntrophica]|uniref:hypothetical protein n=1 Tax=Brucepastera parasyntrophica TaxID=2880008 RepID=UPI00210A3738|nr:hypothetical protein [Brucepastera parasyntrophica]ULQ60024.1 hypothetical protein K7I13_01425 [Brucepastera parasyntrophica]
MTPEIQKLIKRYVLTVVIFLVCVLLIVGINLLTSHRYDEILRNSAEQLLSASNTTSIQLGEKISIPGAGSKYRNIYKSRTADNKRGLVFVTGVTGNSGPQTAVFYYTPDQGTVFSGLVGTKNSDGESYGITNRIIEKWIYTIDRIVSKNEEYLQNE